MMAEVAALNLPLPFLETDERGQRVLEPDRTFPAHVKTFAQARAWCDAQMRPIELKWAPRIARARAKGVQKHTRPVADRSDPTVPPR
jgi:hypothetical protein